MPLANTAMIAKPIHNSQSRPPTLRLAYDKGESI
jgi:hypothetical protein